MTYTDDALRAKLASLNETQDSIVTNAQWIMFHRRHAPRTAQLWLERLHSSPLPKRLNLLYLANEVVQQSRARGKQDFLLAFEPTVTEAVGIAYKGAGAEVQGKVRRVVEVWRQRGIFGGVVLESVEARLGEIDRMRGAGRSGKQLGGSLFGGSSGSGGGLPQELDAVAKAQAAVTKAEVAVTPAKEGAEKEYARMEDPNAVIPSPPVYAARLSALMKNLSSAQGALEASIRARRDLLAGLEKLLETNRAKLATDEAMFSDITAKKDTIEAKKKEVEDGIMRGLSAPATPIGSSSANTNDFGSTSNGQATNGGAELSAPETEGFTPPPPDVESFTPPSESEPVGTETEQTAAFLGGPEETIEAFPPSRGTAENIHELPTNFEEPPPSFEPPAVLETQKFASSSPRVRQASTEVPVSADPRLKRRKMSHPKASSSGSGGDVDGEIFGHGETGVDEDGVAALLQR